MGTYLDNVALKVAQYVDGSYKQCDVHRIVLESNQTLDICSALLEGKKYDNLVDFDNHLDNVKLDWKNPNINEEIEKCY